jgi:predicted O-methyltransferase YrrM
LAASVARLAGRRDRASRAVAAALRDTALGRMSAPERAWVARIEERRSGLPRRALESSRSDEELGSANRDEVLAQATGMCGLISISPVWGRFLMHLVRELTPESCLELGTGLGMSALYQGAALELNGSGSLITVDTGEWARMAEREFSDLGLEGRIELLLGPAGDTLARALDRGTPFDCVLLDADHTEEGTLAHFGAILPHLSDRAVVIVDDINWTSGMRRAWKVIRRTRRVALAVGIRRFGIAVVNKSAGNP